MTQTDKDKVTAALQPLATIAMAYLANQLDDEARYRWGPNNEHTNTRDFAEIIIYSGRGGKQLLTLQDCFNGLVALTAVNSQALSRL